MSSPSMIAVRNDSLMSRSKPRASGPTPKRSLTPKQILAYLAAYNAAIKNNEGAAYLRTKARPWRLVVPLKDFNADMRL